jgi:hypothetical protein
MGKPLPNIDTLIGFFSGLNNRQSHAEAARGAGFLFCPNCAMVRRHDIYARQGMTYILFHDERYLTLTPDSVISQGITTYCECVECRCHTTAAIYSGPQGGALALLTSAYGGIVTIHTPPEVRYYADQAQRAESIGARSAAIAMYRTAVEHILFSKGFEERMLGPKIGALEAALAGQTQPRWARDVDTEVLRVLKKLGDGAIHPNDGDVTRQDALDGELLSHVKIAFGSLVYEAYEREHELAARKAVLASAEAVLSKPKQSEPANRQK